MDLSIEPLRLTPRVPFRTAKAVRTERRNLWVIVTHENIVGWGEAAPVDTYDQSSGSAESALGKMFSLLKTAHPLESEPIIHDLLDRFPGQSAAVAAVDAALHDWAGKRFGIPTCHWLGLAPAPLPLTSVTIGLDAPDRMAERARAAAGFPILKLKLGGADDEEKLRRVRAAIPEKTLRVDANEAWDLDTALGMLPLLKKCGVEFLEQPLPRDDLAGLRRLREQGVLPIVADESCVRPADVIRVAGCVDAVNVKLAKCGGIRQALKMIHLARAHGLKVMLGCMVESSLGIAAAAQLGPLADWLDLDGHLLLANDPFTGIGGEGGRLRIGTSPGLGVSPTAGG